MLSRVSICVLVLCICTRAHALLPSLARFFLVLEGFTHHSILLTLSLSLFISFIHFSFAASLFRSLSNQPLVHTPASYALTMHDLTQTHTFLTSLVPLHFVTPSHHRFNLRISFSRSLGVASHLIISCHSLPSSHRTPLSSHTILGIIKHKNEKQPEVGSLRERETTHFRRVCFLSSSSPWFFFGFSLPLVITF